MLSHISSTYTFISYQFYSSRKEDSKYWGKTLMTKIQVTIYSITLEQLNPKLISPLLFPCFFLHIIHLCIFLKSEVSTINYNIQNRSQDCYATQQITPSYLMTRHDVSHSRKQSSSKIYLLTVT